MSSGEDPCPEHPVRTAERRLRYCFYSKHHSRGGPEPSQWAEDLGRDEEFSIFDEADRADLSDESGNLYGLRRHLDGRFLPLGTYDEQVAKFWAARGQDQPWHGFPLWHLKGDGPGGREWEPVPNDVLTKMIRPGFLTEPQAKRLRRGRSI